MGILKKLFTKRRYRIVVDDYAVHIRVSIFPLLHKRGAAFGFAGQPQGHLTYKDQCFEYNPSLCRALFKELPELRTIFEDAVLDRWGLEDFVQTIEQLGFKPEDCIY